MTMKRILCCLVFLCAACFQLQALGTFGDWTCSVALSGYVSEETGKAPNAYCWIAEGTQTVKFAVLAQQNMTEEALLRSDRFRQQIKEMGGALIWVAPWFSQNWSPVTGCQQTFEEMMVGLAGQSGHPEMATVPIVPFGHSAQATFPWNAYKGDPHEAFWYFDEEMARLTAARYAETDGKQLTTMGIRQMDCSHLDIGETFSMETGWEYVYISGPVRQLSARKFELIPYDCGTDNPKRSHNAWIAAIKPATKTHKRIVQPIRIQLSSAAEVAGGGEVDGLLGGALVDKLTFDAPLLEELDSRGLLQVEQVL